MNRTALLVAFVVAIVVGALFAAYPQLDLAISAFFYDPHTGLFKANVQPWVLHSRDGARYLVALLVAPAFLAVIGKLLLPRRRTDRAS